MTANTKDHGVSNMKKYIIIILCQVFTVQLFGQKIIEGSLNFQKSQKEANVDTRWDFSETRYVEGSLESFLSSKYTVEEWESKYLPIAIGQIVASINKCTSEFGFNFSSNGEKAKYEMIVAPISLSKKGNNDILFTIREKIGNDTLVVIQSIIDFKWSKPFEVVGKNIGKFMKKKRYEINNDDSLIKKCLIGVTTINYRFDYTDAKINGAKLKDFLGMSNNEYSIFTKKIESVFISTVNRKYPMRRKGYKLDNSEELDFEIVLYLRKVRDDGAHQIEGVIVDKRSNKEIAWVESGAGGDQRNTTEALLLEELEESGSCFSYNLAEILKTANTLK